MMPTLPAVMMVAALARGQVATSTAVDGAKPEDGRRI